MGPPQAAHDWSLLGPQAKPMRISSASLRRSFPHRGLAPGKVLIPWSGQSSGPIGASFSMDFFVLEWAGQGEVRGKFLEGALRVV